MKPGSVQALGTLLFLEGMAAMSPDQQHARRMLRDRDLQEIADIGGTSVANIQRGLEKNVAAADKRARKNARRAAQEAARCENSR